MTKKLGNYKDNDVELCRTTNARVGNQTAEVLLSSTFHLRRTASVFLFSRERRTKVQTPCG